MLNKCLIYYAYIRPMFVAFLLFYLFSYGVMAGLSVGSGFAESVVENGISNAAASKLPNATVNESSNTRIFYFMANNNATGSGFAKSIEEMAIQINETINESSSATTSTGIGSGFAKSIEINQSISVSGRDFSNMIK